MALAAALFGCALATDTPPSVDVQACISYLDISGSPAHLRYLIQRLRQKLPKDVPILVGLWPAADSALSEKHVQISIGADYFTSSLGESVTACAQAAHKAEKMAA